MAVGERDRHGGRAPSSSGKGMPQRIGDFEVIKTLGTGSFGKVKLGRHIQTGHKVAMKFISKKKIASAEMTNRVQREIAYLMMLQHPHIIKLYDVVSTPDAIVMVIEYLTGELFDYIVETGRMAEKNARRFFQQIIAAVEYCHSNEIVHRDLKPENLLLDEQLNVKIADFGLSNVMKDGDFLKTSCGSPNYAAPEVISGKLYAGPEIDIWSCGVILYVMLCGKLPFDDDHIPMLFKKINGGIFSLPPYLSPGARYLLSRMLVVDSNKRITISEIRAEPWFQESLPAYLAKPARRLHDSEVSGGADSARQPEFVQYIGQEPTSTEGREWIKSVGWIEPEGLREAAEKMGRTEEEILDYLRRDPEDDKRLKVAYSLCADAYRAKLAAQQAHAARSNPPAISQRPLAATKEPANTVTPTPSHIHILPGTCKQTPDHSLARSRQVRNPLTAGRGLSGMTQTEPDAAQRKRAQRTRFHFGIRSRSPPMEVMHELYKTLQSLGFEWKRKPEFRPTSEKPEVLARMSEDEIKKKRRKDDEDRMKAGQALYLVEARCPLDDVMVYMDIQLYQVDENDNYLVDFRNVAYKPLVRRSVSASRAPSESGSERGSFHLAAPRADDVRADIRAEAIEHSRYKDRARSSLGASPQVIPRSSATVQSPFLFLDCACKLIFELAMGAQ